MPRKEYNVGRSRSKSHKFAINSLLTKRADLLGDLIALDAQRDSKRLDIEALDRVLTNVFAYDGDLDAIKPTGQRITHFRHGELGRAVMDALRQSDSAMTPREIAFVVGPAKGMDMGNTSVRNGLIARVSRACQKNEGRFVKRYVDAFGVIRWSV